MPCDKLLLLVLIIYTKYLVERVKISRFIDCSCEYASHAIYLVLLAFLLRLYLHCSTLPFFLHTCQLFNCVRIIPLKVLMCTHLKHIVPLLKWMLNQNGIFFTEYPAQSVLLDSHVQLLGIFNVFLTVDVTLLQEGRHFDSVFETGVKLSNQLYTYWLSCCIVRCWFVTHWNNLWLLSACACI